MARYPIGRGNWPWRVPVHLLASMVMGVSHTLLMWGSRIVFHRLLGWGPFDYGQMKYRFLMEYQKQFLLYWGIYLVVVFASYVRKSRERELRAKDLEKRLAEARLETLKTQLNPHFLFNTLNTISSFVHEDPREADRMIGSLSDLLRLTLNQADAQEIPLHKEMELLEAYLSIMRVRFQGHLEVEVSVDSQEERCHVPAMVLQPLVENAIRHATSKPGEMGKVTVGIKGDGDHLLLAVEDNGPGLKGAPEEALNKGLGLSNTVERLEQLYGENHRFELENLASGGLCVSLRIPRRTEEAP